MDQGKNTDTKELKVSNKEQETSLFLLDTEIKSCIIPKLKNLDFDFSHSPQVQNPRKSHSWKSSSKAINTFRPIKEKKKLIKIQRGEKEIYTPKGNFNYDHGFIHKLRINGEIRDVFIPEAGGKAFGLIDEEGNIEKEILKNPKLFTEILLKCGEGMEHPRLTKEPYKYIRELPPLEECTDPSWWPKEAIKLSEETMSLTLASLALISKPRTKPNVWLFSGQPPKRSEIEDWSTEMIIRTLKTFFFCPFIFEYSDIEGERRHMIAQFNIPAFSVKQARIIMAKRLYEFKKLLYRGKPLFTTDELRDMSLPESSIFTLQNGIGTVTKAPRLESIPILGIEDNTSILDFFPLDSSPIVNDDNTLVTSPFSTGQWTSDDIGYAFAILFSKELELKSTTSA